MTDDIGQPIKLMKKEGFADWPIKGDVRIEGLMNRLSLNVSGTMEPWKGLALVPMVAAGGIPLVILFAAASSTARGGQSRTFSLTKADLTHGAVHVTGLVLEEGLCPSCGYNFHGLKPGAEPIVRCPECAAHWHTNRIERTQAFVQAGEKSVKYAYPRIKSKKARLSLMDARCRTVRRFGGRFPKILLGTCGSEQERKQQREAWKQATRNSWKYRLTGLGTVWGIVFVLIAIGAYMGTQRKDTEAMTVLFVLAGLFLLPAVLCTLANFCYSSQAIVPAFFKLALCPSCGRSLVGSDVGRDGCRVCTHCRAAWRTAVADYPRSQALEANATLATVGVGGA